MKRRISLILAIVMALSLLMFAGCGKSEETSTNLETIKQRGKFVVGLDDSFPPMGFRDQDNNIVGFDIDLAKEVAKRWGVDVEFKPVEWSTVINELNNKNIDMIWNGLTITPDRQSKIIFTVPYLKNLQAIVVQEGSDITKREDLVGKKVGIQKASSAEDAFKKHEDIYNNCDITRYNTNDLALTDLEVGRLDAVVVDIIVAGYYTSLKPGVYKILDEDFGGEFFGVGLRKDDHELLKALQETLNEMKADGTMAEISKKWFEEDITL